MIWQWFKQLLEVNPFPSKKNLHFTFFNPETMLVSNTVSSNRNCVRKKKKGNRIAYLPSKKIINIQHCAYNKCSAGISHSTELISTAYRQGQEHRKSEGFNSGEL